MKIHSCSLIAYCCVCLLIMATLCSNTAGATSGHRRRRHLKKQKKPIAETSSDTLAPIEASIAAPTADLSPQETKPAQTPIEAPASPPIEAPLSSQVAPPVSPPATSPIKAPISPPAQAPAEAQAETETETETEPEPEAEAEADLLIQTPVEAPIQAPIQDPIDSPDLTCDAVANGEVLVTNRNVEVPFSYELLTRSTVPALSVAVISDRAFVQVLIRELMNCDIRRGRRLQEKRLIHGIELVRDIRTIEAGTCAGNDIADRSCHKICTAVRVYLSEDSTNIIDADIQDLTMTLIRSSDLSTSLESYGVFHVQVLEEDYDSEVENEQESEHEADQGQDEASNEGEPSNIDGEASESKGNGGSSDGFDLTPLLVGLFVTVAIFSCTFIGYCAYRLRRSKNTSEKYVNGSTRKYIKSTETELGLGDDDQDSRGSSLDSSKDKLNNVSYVLYERTPTENMMANTTVDSTPAEPAEPAEADNESSAPFDEPSVVTEVYSRSIISKGSRESDDLCSYQWSRLDMSMMEEGSIMKAPKRANALQPTENESNEYDYADDAASLGYYSMMGMSQVGRSRSMESMFPPESPSCSMTESEKIVRIMPISGIHNTINNNIQEMVDSSSDDETYMDDLS